MKSSTKSCHSLLSPVAGGAVMKVATVPAKRSRVRTTLTRLAVQTARLGRLTLRKATLDGAVNLLLWVVWLFVLTHCLMLFLR